MRPRPVRIDSPHFHHQPVEAYKKLRAEAPVVRVKIPFLGSLFLTTTHKATTAMLKDNGTFTMRKQGKVAGLQWWMPRSLKLLADNMLTMDEPDHRRLRQAVDQSFNRSSVLTWQPAIDTVAHDLLNPISEQLDRGKEVDLVSGFARKLPLAIIAMILGLTGETRERFAALAGSITQVNSLKSFLGMFGPLRKMTEIIRLEIIASRSSPATDGLISQLVHGEHDLSEDEMIAMTFLLLVAGHETTTHLISGSIRELLLREEHRDWFLNNPDQQSLACEELLRFVSPVQISKPRFVNKNHAFFGVDLKPGDMIVGGLAASNFDPDHFDDPEQLILDRKPNPHIEFGTGIHFCLGHQLARLEIMSALQTLFSRHPDLFLCDQDPQWIKRPGMRGLASLTVKAG